MSTLGQPFVRFPRMNLNGTGITVLDQITYDAYGNITSESSPANRGNYGYAGYRIDMATGEDESDGRWYAPWIGIWTSEDPIQFAGGNPDLYGYVNNDPTNFVDPSGLQGLEPKAYWVQKAADFIAIPQAASEYPLDSSIIRNRYITAAYGKAFQSNPKKFPWFGLAAIASNEVGNALKIIRTHIISEANDNSFWSSTFVVLFVRLMIVKTDVDIATLLARDNLAVYNDIYWQYLAYSSPCGGIKQMEFLHDRGELSAEELDLWKKIDSKNPDDVWLGNQGLFYHEQHDILQPVWDAMPWIPGGPSVGEQIAQFSTPLFRGATRFGEVGSDMSIFAQRWSWITVHLWPQWKKLLETNPQEVDKIMKVLTDLNH